MNPITDYLQSVVTNKIVLPVVNQQIPKAELAEFITAKLTRQKFRKRPLVSETLETIKRKVSISIKKQRSIHIIIPFGGYKHFWNASYPHPNWAEVFHFRHIINYLEPILAVYEPGVELEYISEDLILPRMNNYPKQSLETYAKDFNKLIATAQKISPNNLRFSYWRVSQKIDPKIIIAQIESTLPLAWKNWQKLNKQDQEEQLTRSKRSIFWKGNVDLSNITEKQKHAKIIESRLIEMSYFDVSAMKPIEEHYTKDDHICLVFSWGMSRDNTASFLTLGAVQSSNVDFWIGTGILEQRENEQIVPRIISQNQYKAIEEQLKNVQTGINLAQGLKTIPAYEGKLNFN